MAGPVEQLGQASFDVVVLPGRVGYLIRSGSKDGFRRAVQEACTRWGGATEPIVPVTPAGKLHPWWRQVVELSDVVALVAVDLTSDQADQVRSQIDLPVVPLSRIDDQQQPSSWTVHPVVVAPLMVWGVPATLAANDAPLWAVTAAGALLEPHLEGYSENGMPVLRQPMTDQLARAQLGRHTLLDRSLSQFSERWSQGGFFAAPALIWITPPDSLRDCLFFWNLRALRPLRHTDSPILLLPDVDLTTWLQFDRQLASVLERPDDHEPDVVMVSLGLATEALIAKALSLGLTLSNRDFRSESRYPPPPLRKGPYTFKVDIDPRQWLAFPRRYGVNASVTVPTYRPRTILEARSPVTFDRSGLTLFHLGGGPLVRLPKRPAIASLVLRNADWAHDYLQVRTSALRDYRFELTIPEDAAVLSSLLGASTATHQLSEKGRIAAALRSRMDTSMLLSPGFYEAVLALTTPRSKELLRELEQREAASTRAELVELASTWGGRAARRYRAAVDVRSEIRDPKTQDHLEALVSVGWAERGFEVRCRSCGLRSFVEVTGADAPATCPGCLSPQRYTSTKEGPTVQYRLNTLVDRACDQGVLPHLLAEAALRTSDQDGMDFHLGLDVTFADGTRNEVDLFGVHLAQVMTGEIKTSPAEFTKDQIQRDVRISAALGSDVHLAACIHEIPQRVITAIQREAKKANLETLILDCSQLRPAPP